MAIEAGSSTYYQAKRGIVQDGLVLHLDAGVKESYSGGSTWRDLSGNGNNGTLYNGVYFDRNNRGSLSFDGSNDWVRVNHDEASFNTDYTTLVCWARSNPVNWNNYGFLMSKRNRFVMHPQQSTRSVNCYFYLNGSWRAINVTPSDITIWNMYAYSWTGSSLITYLNGSKTYTYGITATLGTSTDYLRIGYDVSTRYLNGNIAISMIYNRAISDNEVAQIYNATRHRFGL